MYEYLFTCFIIISVYEFHHKSDQEIEQFIDSFDQTIISQLHLENRPSDFLRIKERFFTEGVSPLIAIRNVSIYMQINNNYVFISVKYTDIESVMKSNRLLCACQYYFFFSFNYYCCNNYTDKIFGVYPSDFPSGLS